MDNLTMAKIQVKLEEGRDHADQAREHLQTQNVDASVAAALVSLSLLLSGFSLIVEDEEFSKTKVEHDG